MTESARSPGWYPDATGKTLQWWNGSFYSGQTWQPTQDEPLYDLIVTSIHSKVPARAELMKALGMTKQHATDSLATVPSLVATNLQQAVAQAVHDAITNVNGVSTRHCTAEIRPAGSVSLLLPGRGGSSAESVVFVCRNCGFELAPDDSFYSECGRTLDG